MQGIKLNQCDKEPIVIPIPWYVITHEQGYVIIDGGNPAPVAEDPVAHWGDMIAGCVVEMRPDQACVPTLLAHGFRTEDVRHIIQTHLHADHVGAVSESGAFRNALVHVSRREYDYALQPHWHLAPDYIQRDFTGSDVEWDYMDDSASHDLLGDGSIILYPTPGHTVGHLSVEVRLPHAGSVLLTGDAAYTRDHWERRALPGIVASTIDAVTSVEKLRKISETNNSLVIFGHDIEQWSSIPREGDFLD
jgi:glyoxylase-like metal-dependent hydrolase (beta-lactamase superfamily II)